MDDLRSVGKLLRSAREEALLTQRALGARAGVPQSTIGAIESGRHLASLRVLQTLLASLDLQLDIRLEPAFTDLDAQLDEWAVADVDERIAMATRRIASPVWLLMCLAGSGAVLTGALGAAILGAPVPVAHMDALVPRDHAVLESVSTALQRFHASSPDVGTAGPGALASEEADPTSVWYSGGPDLHLTLVDASVLERMRARHRAQAARDSGSTAGTTMEVSGSFGTGAGTRRASRKPATITTTPATASST